MTGKIENLQATLGMNPHTGYTHSTGSSEQEQYNDKYMSFEMNMLIMHHVYHLSIEMEVKNPAKVPKSTSDTPNQASVARYRLSNKLGK